MFVRGVVVGDGVNDFSAWNDSLHGGKEANEFPMPMLVHTMPDHGSVEDVERGEERDRAVGL